VKNYCDDENLVELLATQIFKMANVCESFVIEKKRGNHD